eukprot:Mrub_02997.p1 GENE.Mrub_02997~~Mrub_02997.p1  ORF type:complete len:481 (-),score=95.90 Mrub_02997:116-1558(-)
MQFSSMGSSGRLTNNVKKRSDSLTREKNNKLPDIKQNGMMNIERLSSKENQFEKTNLYKTNHSVNIGNIPRSTTNKNAAQNINIEEFLSNKKSNGSTVNFKSSARASSINKSNSVMSNSKNYFTLEDDYKIYKDRLPSDEPNMRKISLLGKGGFAVVFKVTYGGETIALKQASKTGNYKADSDLAAAKNEIELQNYLIKMHDSLTMINDNPEVIMEGYKYICKMVYYKNDKNDIWIGYELGAETLMKLTYKIRGAFENGGRMYNIDHEQMYVDMCQNNQILKSMLKKLLSVLHYLSNLKLVHADIKPENILIDYDSSTKKIKDIKLIDWGTSYIKTSNPSYIGTNIATPEYCPPEQLVMNREMLAAEPDWAHDMWSLGVVLLELILGWPVWMSMKSRVLSQINRGEEIIATGIFSVPCREKAKIRQLQLKAVDNLDGLLQNAMGVSVDANLRDLLSKMLKVDGCKRISPIDALKHHYFSY